MKGFFFFKYFDLNLFGFTSKKEVPKKSKHHPNLDD